MTEPKRDVRAAGCSPGMFRTPMNLLICTTSSLSPNAAAPYDVTINEKLSA